MNRSQRPAQYIDPEKGPHAAADLSDSEVDYLLKVMVWELGLRTTREECLRVLMAAIEARESLQDQVEHFRHERAAMYFEREVLADLADLPTVTEPDISST